MVKGLRLAHVWVHAVSLSSEEQEKKEVLDTKEGGNRKPTVPSYAAQHLAGEGTQEQKNKGVAVPRMKGQLR